MSGFVILYKGDTEGGACNLPFFFAKYALIIDEGYVNQESDSGTRAITLVKMMIRGSVALFVLFLFLYPLLRGVALCMDNYLIVESWILLGMSLSHFLVWVALLIFWIIAVGMERIEEVSFLNVGKIIVGILLSITLLFIFGFQMEGLYMFEASQKYFENGNFEKEPWRTRLVKDLDIAGRHPSFPRDVIYPIKNSSNVIAIALSIVIEYGDGQESTEMLLEGLETSVVPDQYEDGEEYVIYSLPIGYYRKIPVVKIQYQDGVVVSIRHPEWLINSQT